MLPAVVPEEELLEDELLEEELDDELEELDDEVELLAALLDELLLELLEELLEEEVVLEPEPLQAAPVTAGISAVPPLVLPIMPNSTVCPGAMLPFQLKFVAL